MHNDLCLLKFYEGLRVFEKHESNGCIASSFQWLLDWYCIANDITLDTDNIQKLIVDKIPIGSQNFESISKIVVEEYNLKGDFFKKEAFKTGVDKINRITELIANQIGVLIAITSGFTEINSANPSSLDLWNIKQIPDIISDQITTFFNDFKLKNSYNPKIGLKQLWRIVPVVGISKKNLFIYDAAVGFSKQFLLTYIEFLHNNLEGGKDILWINPK
ncbi:MAG: hypothetical protein ACFFDW_17605 [Candidatus Thorarchaeota archaeon]